MTARPRVDLFSLSSSRETRKKQEISRASRPGIFSGHFFSRGLFAVLLNGLSERQTTRTRSLNDGINKNKLDLRRTTSGPHFTTDRSWNLLSCFMGCHTALFHLNIRQPFPAITSLSKVLSQELFQILSLSRFSFTHITKMSIWIPDSSH